jgi:CelD/BcsL family acetyltransferase involved in cellulose biosynthesis
VIVDLIPARSLSLDLQRHWRTLQAGNTAADSPFLHPAFTLAVADVRPQVMVAVVRDGDQPLAFFPYEQLGSDTAAPVGGRINDRQGIVAVADFPWQLEDLLRQSSLQSSTFTEMTPDQATSPRASIVRSHQAPYIELPAGYAAYQEQLRERGGQRIVQFERKLRKLEREVGPVRLESNSRDAAVWRQLIAWKTPFYAALHVANPLQSPACLAVWGSLFSVTADDFQCGVTALYAGDTLAAATLALRAGPVWHYWIPSYNPNLERYSPGSLLLVKLAMEAEQLGIRRLDLGPGVYDYKQSLATGAWTVVEGAVHLSRTRAWLHRGWQSVRTAVKSSGLHATLRRPVRMLRETLDRWGQRS